MGYTAMHPQWGRLDASLDDLGCHRAWSDVHRVKGIELACPECKGRVFARSSHYRVRHFYHQVRPQDCELANESAEHHLLKLELAMAARAAGWRAELEVSSAARDWRADVLVYDEQGQPVIALEVQLSPMTTDDAQLRTDRYTRDGVAVCWIALGGQPWQRAAPTLLVRAPEQRGEFWTVWHGMLRYDWTPRTLRAKAAWTHITCPLGDAIRWILARQAQAHTRANGQVWWTAPAYVQLAVERAQLEAEVENRERIAAAVLRRQEDEERAQADLQRQKAAIEREAALEKAWQAELRRLAGFFRHAGMNATVWQAFQQMVRSESEKLVFFGRQSPAHGNGLLVYTRPRRGGEQPRLSGVVCPDPGMLDRWPVDLTILVPNQTWLSRIQAAARGVPLKVAVLNPDTGRSAFHRVP